MLVVSILSLRTGGCSFRLIFQRGLELGEGGFVVTTPGGVGGEPSKTSRTATAPAPPILLALLVNWGPCP